jgi:hypothetical protein
MVVTNLHRKFGFSVTYDPSALVARVDQGYSADGALTMDFLLRGVSFTTSQPKGTELLGRAEGLAVWAVRHSAPPKSLSLPSERRWYSSALPKTMSVTSVGWVDYQGVPGVRVSVAWKGGHGFYCDIVKGPTSYHVVVMADDRAWASMGASLRRAAASLRLTE